MPKLRSDYRTPSLINFCKSCDRCEIGKEKNQEGEALSVGGAGPEDLSRIKLIVISDYPGFYEEKYGFPFVNKSEAQQLQYEEGKRKKPPDINRNAGALIREMLSGMFDLDTYHECYMTNVLKCEPGKRTVEEKHLRACASWLKEEFEILDQYIPRIPILVAGTKALRGVRYLFKDFARSYTGGLNTVRRRGNIKLGQHPSVFTFNPAIVARSEPRIEVQVNKRNRRVKSSRWLYPPLPGSPTHFVMKDLEFLDPFLWED